MAVLIIRRITVLENYINVGDKIEIQSRHNKNNAYLSQLLSINDQKNITVFSPISRGKIIPLTLNIRYDILFITPKRCYRCIGVPRKRGKKDGIAYTDIEIVGNVEKFQRRNYFRFRCILNMKYILLEDDQSIERDIKSSDIKDNAKSNLNSAVVRDISGGGLRFVSNTLIQSGRRIVGTVDFDGYLMRIAANIVSKENINHNIYKFEYRAAFINISEADRERIIKYVFEKQRKDLQREKGM